MNHQSKAWDLARAQHGVISRIQTPVTAAALERAGSAKAPRQAARTAGYDLSLDTSNHVAIRVTRHGKAVRDATVSVTYTILDMPMAPSAETVHETSAGVYSGRGPAVSMSGRWRLSIRVAPSGKRAFTTRVVSVLRPATG